MKQVIQNLRTGEQTINDIPAPRCAPGHLLIATHRSLISAGTERMLVEFGQGNLVQKARSQPDKVRQVLDKARTDGVLPTIDAVFSRLDQPMTLGYCNAGTVIEVGQGVEGYAVGDRVASNGPHAEVVCVPKNLCAHIPDEVSDDQAAFTVLASVALEGIRLTAPTLGESVVVIGLGLVGLLTVQLLKANGCRVLGIDFNKQRLEFAKSFGAETVDLSVGQDPIAAGMAFSGGRGADAVLICASAKSNDIVHQAAQMSRKRGRIVLVGIVGLELSRADFYDKELSFQVSCSYGPGRYDANYEQKGHDYPLGYVRWTEQRNLQAVLQLMADGKLNTGPLTSHHIPVESASDAYALVVDDPSALGVLLTYTDQAPDLNRLVQQFPAFVSSPGSVATVGVIGAGSFASVVMLPALAKTSAVLKTIASSGGVSASHAAQKFGFVATTTDYHVILNDPKINTVFIATRHNTHARLAAEALVAGKHVFVEKPLALDRNELESVKLAVAAAPECQLMVGYNRRFAPLAIRMKELLTSRSEPVSLIYTVNAGAIPIDHWTQDPMVGGGRIIGEGCHFIDLLRYLVGHPIVGIDAHALGKTDAVFRDDKVSIFLEFADGSTGVVHYLANGSKRYPKERVEAFCQGRVLVLDNYRTLKGYGWPGFRKASNHRQDKGHAAELAAFVDKVQKGGEWLIAWNELEQASLATFVAVEHATKPLLELS